MNRIASATLLALTLALGSCGGSPTTPSINGNWSATLTNTDGSPAFAFTATLTQAMGSSVNVTNLTFNIATSCFSGVPPGDTATFAQSDIHGKLAGPFELTVSTQFPTNHIPTNNVIMLQGQANDATIAGTWTLTGQPTCTGKSGPFIMKRISGNIF